MLRFRFASNYGASVAQKRAIFYVKWGSGGRDFVVASHWQWRPCGRSAFDLFAAGDAVYNADTRSVRFTELT